MINYETLFILDPALEDEKKDAAIEMVKGVISADGEVGEVDVWGLKKLAYPIQKKNEGNYSALAEKFENASHHRQQGRRTEERAESGSEGCKGRSSEGGSAQGRSSGRSTRS